MSLADLRGSGFFRTAVCSAPFVKTASEKAHAEEQCHAAKQQRHALNPRIHGGVQEVLAPSSSLCAEAE